MASNLQFLHHPFCESPHGGSLYKVNREMIWLNISLCMAQSSLVKTTRTVLLNNNKENTNDWHQNSEIYDLLLKAV